MILTGQGSRAYRHHSNFHKPGRHGGKAAAEGHIEIKKSGGREIKVVRRVLDVNEEMAAQNRRMFAERGIFVLNLMSSPGSGKTTLLRKTLLEDGLAAGSAVIVGDICTTNDAERLAETGVPVVQINTDEFGGDCHLTALAIENAFKSLEIDSLDLLIVENVGNLVCPAEFDIGEDARAVILSVTEGEDKPLKYPLMFRECDVALLSKTDLLPYLDFDADLAEKNMLQIHPHMPVIRVSSKTGEGFEAWIAWIKAGIERKKAEKK